MPTDFTGVTEKAYGKFVLDVALVDDKETLEGKLFLFRPT
jgi:hypothetical protein